MQFRKKMLKKRQSLRRQLNELKRKYNDVPATGLPEGEREKRRKALLAEIAAVKQKLKSLKLRRKKRIQDFKRQIEQQ